MILVFGSINVDVVVPVPRAPAAGETVLGGDHALLPGGKGANQALAARRAGADVRLAGAVGVDSFAEIALATLRRDGVDLELVRSVDRPTGCAAILVTPDGENRIAVAPGANADAAAASIPDAALGPGTIVVVQLEVPAAETMRLIDRARRGGARVILNLAPAAPLDGAVLGGVDLLVANAGEAASLGEPPEALARRLRQGLVVTGGAAGATCYARDGGAIAVPALPIAPVDTTGAGDTFVGVLAAALDRGADLPTALLRASAAAGLACLAAGAQTAMPDAAAIDQAAARLAGQPPQ